MASTSPLIIPSMSDIQAATSAQGLSIRLSTLGPFFRAQAHLLTHPSTKLGRARPWAGGNVLHLDSMRMSRATLEVLDRPIFGLGLFLGVVVVRHVYLHPPPTSPISIA